MKRCPQCQFIHLDQDEFCDFDGARLQIVDDAELEETGNAPGTRDAKRPLAGREKKRLAMVIAGAAALSAVLTASYLGLSYRVSRSRENNAPIPVNQPVAQLPSAAVDLTPTPNISPSPSPSEMQESSVKTPSPSRTEPARGVISRSPVSTGNENNPSHSAVRIRLTNGATVEADEVWRTKEGVWYRRHGMVTLLKRDRVKAIDRTTPSPK